MYTDYFGFSQRPFEILPDSQFLWLSDQHARAIANIKFALLNRDSFVVITGEIGIGKTTILNRVFSDLEKEIVLARLTHTTLSPVELLQATLLAFGETVDTKRKVVLIDRLRNFLMAQHEAGKPVVVVVDEAQNLSLKALEELRLLTCSDSDESPLLTVVLVGQPTLSELIDAPELANLRQRTRLRQHLEPLTKSDTADYLRHRVSVAGGEFSKVFTKGIEDRIFELTRGVPRLINTLCDTALTACAAYEKPRVTKAILTDVVNELAWTTPQVPGPVVVELEEKPPARRAWLIRSDESEGPPEIRVSTVPFLIGADELNNLVLKERGIHQWHALICVRNGKFMIDDLSNEYGVTVNGSSFSSSILRSGDQITVGPVQLLFYSDAYELSEIEDTVEVVSQIRAS